MTTTTPQAGGVITRAVMSLINLFMPFVFMMSFALAAMLSSVVILGPSMLLIVLPLTLIALFSGTYTSWQNAHDTQKKMIEKVGLSKAAQTDPDPDDIKAATMIIPGFTALLKRNALVTVFYGPLVLIISALAMAGLMGVMDLIQDVAQNRGGAKLIAGLLVPAILWGWVFAVSVAAGRISSWVDRRLLKASFELPEGEEVRQKRLMREAMSAASQGKQKSAGAKLLESGKMIFQMVKFMVLMAGPIFLALGLLMILPLPDSIRGLLFMLIMPLMIIWPLYLLYRTLFGGKGSPFSAVVKNLEEEMKKAETPEEQAEMQAAIAEIQQQQTLKDNSLEGRVMKRLMLIMFMVFGAVITIPLFAGGVIRALGLGPDAASTVTLVLLVLGTIFIFALLKFMPARFLPKSQGEVMLTGLEDMIRQGKNRDAIALVERAMETLPNWETMIPAAATYAGAGYLHKGEQIANQVMQEAVQATDDYKREMAKVIIPGVLGLLTEIALTRGDYEKAKELNQRVIEFPIQGYPAFNTQAHLHLRLRQPDQALLFIEKAAQDYQKEGKPVSGMNMAYRAWALAQQGDIDGMKPVFKEALEQVDPSHKADRAEIHLIGGFIALDLKRPGSAAKRFEVALDLNPNGIIGHQARVELEKLS